MDDKINASRMTGIKVTIAALALIVAGCTIPAQSVWAGPSDNEDECMFNKNTGAEVVDSEEYESDGSYHSSTDEESKSNEKYTSRDKLEEIALEIDLVGALGHKSTYERDYTGSKLREAFVKDKELAVKWFTTEKNVDHDPLVKYFKNTNNNSGEEPWFQIYQYDNYQGSYMINGTLEPSFRMVNEKDGLVGQSAYGDAGQYLNYYEYSKNVGEDKARPELANFERIFKENSNSRAYSLSTGTEYKPVLYEFKDLNIVPNPRLGVSHKDMKKWRIYNTPYLLTHSARGQGETRLDTAEAIADLYRQDFETALVGRYKRKAKFTFTKAIGKVLGVSSTHRLHFNAADANDVQFVKDNSLWKEKSRYGYLKLLEPKKEEFPEKPKLKKKKRRKKELPRKKGVAVKYRFDPPSSEGETAPPAQQQEKTRKEHHRLDESIKVKAEAYRPKYEASKASDRNKTGNEHVVFDREHPWLHEDYDAHRARAPKKLTKKENTKMMKALEHYYSVQGAKKHRFGHPEGAEQDKFKSFDAPRVREDDRSKPYSGREHREYRDGKCRDKYTNKYNNEYRKDESRK